MRLRKRVSVLMALCLASPLLAAAAPKEGLIWEPIQDYTFGLYLSDPNGKNERPLLAGSGSNYNPAFSPDGRWIVFTSERFGSADVFRVHPDGSGLERLTDSPAFDDQGVLSPDGRTLAFVSTREGGSANIWLLDIGKRGRAINLTKSRSGNFRPSWSPDGRWIAFSSDRGTPRLRYIRDTGSAWELMQTTAIYIVHPDGSGLRRLTALDGCAGTPKWSRDGRHVLFYQVVEDVEAMRHFQRHTQIVSMEINTGAREVHSDGSQFAWSPAYVGETDIGYGINEPRGLPGGPRGTSIVYTSGRKGPAGAANPSWSPDGSLMVYDKGTPVERKWVEFWPSRDTRYELITGKAFTLDIVPFTRSGEQFIYKTPRSQQLKLVHWDGVGSVIFDGGADNRNISHVALSADGRTLAFNIWDSKHPDEVGQIAVVNSDGTHFRVLTHDVGHDDYPSFSPDGARLVYRLGKYEERLHTRQGLRLLSLADGKVVELTNGWDSTPVWSPRGDRIAFTGFETGDFEIYTIRPDGTGLRQLTDTRGNDAHPVWSPDGKWIAFDSSRMGWKDEALLPWRWAQSYGEIFVMRADGTDVRQLTDNQWEEGVIGWASQPRNDRYPGAQE
jgi:TolB protein